MEMVEHLKIPMLYGNNNKDATLYFNEKNSYSLKQ